MKRQIQLLILLLVVTASSFAQKVKDIEVEVHDDKIIVGYIITGLMDYQDISSIGFYVSLDGGKTFRGPLKEITGNVGPNIRNGGYAISWDVFKEIPFTDEELIFDIRLSIIERNRKKAIMVSIVGNTITPIGIRVGMLGKVGWYAEFRSSLMSPFTTAEYTYSNGSIIDYNKAGYYEFNNNNGYVAWSAIGGATFQLSRFVYLNVGIGYGVQNYVYEIDEYSYNPQLKTGTALTKDDAYSYSGYEVDAGIILKLKKVIISGGLTTISFKTIFWTGGIGIAF